MSDRSRDNIQRHPADERTADQSTQSAAGLSTTAEDILNRNEEGRYETPRQYEEDDDSTDATPPRTP